MAVLLQEHVKDEKKAWAKFCRRVSKVGEGRHVVASRQTTAIKGEGSTGELGETNGTETNNAPWAKESHRDFTVIEQAYWGHISWKKLTFGQSGHRFAQCTPGSENVGRKATSHSSS